ncbi:MAG: SPFH domain-containing protein [Erysipelotrichia bacterium]|nr:SPFH domain-containing protein [Erysipelotrichia bacterium]
MGLIRAGLGAAISTLKDSWKDYIYCDSLENDVLVAKGQRHTSGLFSNNNGNDNIITNGSNIIVNDGQCMIIVDQGKVVEVCAEAGGFTYDSSSSPSLFGGNLVDGIQSTFQEIKERFVFGGEVAKDQRVYYFNTKEILDNKFGTVNPIPFKVVDKKINLDVDVSIRLAGQYSYRIIDPVLFYSNVCGNVASVYTRDEIDNQLKAEFISALQPAIGKLSSLEMRPNEIVNHNSELEVYLNEALSAKWSQTRGIKVVNVAIATVTLPEEDAEMIKMAQKAGMYTNAAMAGAGLVDAQIEAMKNASKNSGGAAVGFMGMNMAQNAGGMNAMNFFNMNNQQQAQQAAQQQGWTCSCGTVNTGKFCSNCGSAKPTDGSWTCSCGTVNTGNFCSNCGSKKPQ